MHIENCVVPHSWCSIEKCINDGLYLKILQGSTTTYKILTIPSTNYTGSTLLTAVQSALNVEYPGLFTVTYDITINCLKINITSGNFFQSTKRC